MAYNDRRYSTLHSPDESQTYSLHTPVDSFNTPGPGPYNHPEHTGEHITHPTPFSSPSLSQNPSPYYPAPPLQQSNSFPIATSSRPLSMIPASAHNSPPGSPGLPPLPGVETFMMTTPQPARSPPPAFEGHQYQPAQFAPPPVSMSPPPAFNPLDPNPQAQQGATLPVPPQPLSTPTYIPSDASTGPQTPKTPVYTPGAASGPNGAIHAPGQIGHPNQQHGPTEYHNGMCSCFSDIPTCCTGYWCPCILYSKTYHRLKTLPNSNLNEYSACNAHCAMFCFLAPVSFILTMLQRSRVRDHYQLRGTSCSDCAKAYCCVSCTLIQDDREVRHREDEKQRFAGPGSGAVGEVGYRRQPSMAYPK